MQCKTQSQTTLACVFTLIILDFHLLNSTTSAYIEKVYCSSHRPAETTDFSINGHHVHFVSVLKEKIFF